MDRNDELNIFLGLILSRKEDFEIRDVKDKYRKERLLIQKAATTMKEYIILEEAYNNFMSRVSEIVKEV